MLLKPWMMKCYLVTMTKNLDNEMLSRNNDEKLDQELDANLKLRNVSQNPPIYNIKYIE